MKTRNITVTGLSIQFDGDVAWGDTQAAKELARKVVGWINGALSASGLACQPQIFGGDNIDGSQVEIGGPVGEEEDHEADTAELVKLATDEKWEDDALDELVHEATQEEGMGEVNDTDDDDEQEEIIGGNENRASDINNGGHEEQIKFLLKSGFTREQIIEAGRSQQVANCQRCGSVMTAAKCMDQTCPFSDHWQECPKGWLGHPEHPEVTEDTPCQCDEITRKARES